MNRTLLTALTALLMLTTGLATATTDSVAPVGPIANGNFETFAAPDEIKGPLQDTPADECIGIGHQANWGTDTPQGALTGGEFSDAPDDSDPDPTRLVDRYSDDPASQAQTDGEEQAGYGHCEFSDEKGHDAYWLNPAGAGGTTDDEAAFWSIGEASAGFDFDEDPFDKEILIESNPSNGGDHNIWQNMFHPGREAAFSANFDALEFDVEDGAIADDASVKISLGAEPLNTQERYTVIYIDCVLSFPGSYLQESLTAGTVSASPVGDGVNFDGEDDPDCPNEVTRENLGRLSIVQVSFWNFNHGGEDIVIDNIALPGATTHAEEAADGNVRVCTDLAEVDEMEPIDEATCATSAP